MTARLARLAAWTIALAGVVDPVMTLTRPVKPDVALVAAGRLPDPALVDRVERALQSQFTVIRGSSLGAAAVVSVGYQLPPVDARSVGRGFAVLPEPRQPFAAIDAVAAPVRGSLQARIPIDVRIHTQAARGRTLTLTLRRAGVPVDQAQVTVAADDTTENVRLEFVSSAPGLANLSVEAHVEGAAASTVELTQTIQDERWAVLCFDRRPSWIATFVRRALESDPRFVVTSRVTTSRGAPAITAGQPPAALSSLPSLELFQTVVVGAPENLTDEDVSGLTRFMRERAGAVILLLDEPDPTRHSAAMATLTGLTHWALTERATPWGNPPASAVLRPTTLPGWTEPVSPSDPKDAGPPSVWRMSVGRGLLVVSGALDAWRYRDQESASFNSYWRRIVAHSSQAAADLAEPAGERSGQRPQTEPDERQLIRNWSASRGGGTIGESALTTLAPALAEALAPVSERRTFRPMHTGWWMLPFAAALGYEWWHRRRHGLR